MIIKRVTIFVMGSIDKNIPNEYSKVSGTIEGNTIDYWLVITM